VRGTSRAIVNADHFKVMRTRVQKMAYNKVNVDVTYEAVSDNEILFVFKAPGGSSGDPAGLGDLLELDPTILEASQAIGNITTGRSFVACIRKHDVHDLRLPMTHGVQRFPSPERFLTHNQSTDPTLASGTRGAGHQSSHP
jgi:hypothetical protein